MGFFGSVGRLKGEIVMGPPLFFRTLQENFLSSQLISCRVLIMAEYLELRLTA